MIKTINVNMDGDGYLNYLAFRESHRPDLSGVRRFFLASGPYLLSAFVLLLVVAFLHSTAPVPETEYFNFFGVPLMKAVPSILVMLLGVGVAFHGLALVRR